MAWSQSGFRDSPFLFCNLSFSMHKERTLFDAGGREVASTMQKMFSAKTVTYICSGAEPNEVSWLAEVKRKVLSSHPQVEVFFSGNTSKVADLGVQGTSNLRVFRISNRAGHLVADMTRDQVGWWARICGAPETYTLRVFPGVDSAFMVVLFTIIVEMCVERRRRQRRAAAAASH
eukprot:TRINITY_DN8492_c0_g1_i2.p1 TRINITY_DN8492_c0_g1~~TRINITY_DN8492_c0_g1_i2.p1  ORF type:complete len:190 (-),score=22.83 TRINITY_DN8492_c0_g1_i2:549-1073(-)